MHAILCILGFYDINSIFKKRMAYLILDYYCDTVHQIINHGGRFTVRTSARFYTNTLTTFARDRFRA
jgi:hypothetical protein